MVTIIAPVGGVAVDPDAQIILDLVAASGRPPLPQLGVEAARLAVRASQALFGEESPPCQVRDSACVGQEGAVPLRIYRPEHVAEHAALPALLFIHGGGWVLGDLDYGDWFCASLAGRLGIVVVSAGYRLAPEHPFPAGLEDCLAALDHIAAQADALAIDADRIAICGDSAGGNLAATCAIHARDRGQTLRSQILIYPVTDLAAEAPSYDRNAAGFGLTRDALRWFRGLYLRDADPADWRASPLRAERLGGVAPALVLTAGLDPLSDEGDAYAERLADEGVPVRHLHYPGQIHNFLMWAKAIGAAEDAMARIMEELRARLLA